MPELQFEYSSWLVIICLLLGSGYALLLYSKKNPWSDITNRILAIIRFIVVSFILILILNPLLKQLVRQIEKPVIVIAVDDSSSIKNSTDSLERTSVLNRLSKLVSDIESTGFDVVTRSLAQSSVELGEISFSEKTTDLNAMIRNVETLFDGRNLHSTLLISDGNYNRGISPV